MEHDNQTIRQFLCPFGFEPPDYVWKKMHLRTVPAKAVLVLAGSNLNAIDILLQGEIHVVNSFSDGKEFGYTNERSLTLLGDIEYFSGVKQYASSVIAKTTVTLAELDLDLAMLHAVDSSIRYVKSQGKVLHEQSLLTQAYYSKLAASKKKEKVMA